MQRVEDMTLTEVQRELRSYKPLTAGDLRCDTEHTERRAALWRAIDRFRKAGAFVKRQQWLRQSRNEK